MKHPEMPRVAELVQALALAPHPEGGHYAEVFRAAARVRPEDGRDDRSSLTSIDFLLAQGQFSAWHRVRSDEAWHLLEGEGLRLWLVDPGLTTVQPVELGRASGRLRPRHVVPAGWWQAAEPTAGYAYCGATVGPGFEFADFDFGRAEPTFGAALQRLAPELARLL